MAAKSKSLATKATHFDKQVSVLAKGFGEIDYNNSVHAVACDLAELLQHLIIHINKGRQHAAKIWP